MYGSSFMFATLRPRFSISAPIDAETMPLPSDDTTPPVTNTNLVCCAIASSMARQACARSVLPTAPPSRNLGHVASGDLAHRDRRSAKIDGDPRPRRRFAFDQLRRGRMLRDPRSEENTSELQSG